ncbi:MAG: hypothetical protein JO007_17825, partial [Alphaproteobacteria bacterium]|nr:hypothetical protein [Alphaproteobacteria bacterium]
MLPMSLALAVASVPVAASLPFPVSAPAEGSPSASVTAAISICFAPAQDCAGLVVAAIEHARHQILVNAYNLTTGAGIVEALVRARARGVDVQLIADKRTPCERNTGITALADVGTPIWIDRVVPIAHAKGFSKNNLNTEGISSTLLAWGIRGSSGANIERWRVGWTRRRC